MRIQVRGESQNINLVLPTTLIFSRGIVWLANHFGRKYAAEAMANIEPGELEALFAEFRQIKRKYGKWDLVEVESADGEYVKITL